MAYFTNNPTRNSTRNPTRNFNRGQTSSAHGLPRHHGRGSSLLRETPPLPESGRRSLLAPGNNSHGALATPLPERRSRFAGNNARDVRGSTPQPDEYLGNINLRTVEPATVVSTQEIIEPTTETGWVYSLFAKGIKAILFSAALEKRTKALSMGYHTLYPSLTVSTTTLLGLTTSLFSTVTGFLINHIFNKPNFTTPCIHSTLLNEENSQQVALILQPQNEDLNLNADYIGSRMNTIIIGTQSYARTYQSSFMLLIDISTTLFMLACTITASLSVWIFPVIYTGLTLCNTYYNNTNKQNTLQIEQDKIQAILNHFKQLGIPYTTKIGFDNSLTPLSNLGIEVQIELYLPQTLTEEHIRSLTSITANLKKHITKLYELNTQ